MSLLDDERFEAGVRRAVALVTAQRLDDDGSAFEAMLDGLHDAVEIGGVISYLATLAAGAMDLLADAESRDRDVYWSNFARATMERHGG